MFDTALPLSDPLFCTNPFLKIGSLVPRKVLIAYPWNRLKASGVTLRPAEFRLTYLMQGGGTIWHITQLEEIKRKETGPFNSATSHFLPKILHREQATLLSRAALMTRRRNFKLLSTNCWNPVYNAQSRCCVCARACIFSTGYGPRWRSGMSDDRWSASRQFDSQRLPFSWRINIVKDDWSRSVTQGWVCKPYWIYTLYWARGSVGTQFITLNQGAACVRAHAYFQQ